MTLQRFREALLAPARSPERLFGASFVPVSALRQTDQPRRPAPELIARACQRIGLDFIFIPASEVWAEEAIDRVAAAGTACVWAIGGPFGTLANRDGWYESLRRTASDLEALTQELEAIIPSLIEQVRRGARLGAAAIVIAEDLAGADGPLFAPDFASERLLPLAGRLAEATLEEGIPAVFHSDGDVGWALHRLSRLGFAAIHPGGLSDAAFSRLSEAASRLGLTVIGGLSTDSHQSRSGTEVSVAELVMADNVLLADDGGIMTPAELERLACAASVFRGLTRRKGFVE